jgi:hypothetical protein
MIDALLTVLVLGAIRARAWCRHWRGGGLAASETAAGGRY